MLPLKIFAKTALVFLITTIQAEHNISPHCGDFKAQQLLDIDMLLGKWYTIEVIYHDKSKNITNSFYNECPLLFLEDITKDKNTLGHHHNYMENENYMNPYHQNHQNNMENQEDILNWDELMEPLLKVWKEQKNNERHRHDQRRTTTTRPNEDSDDFKKQTLHRLRLIWNRDDMRSEYVLHYNNSRPGYWMSFGSRIDSIHNQQNNYMPFIGTIQVLKAIRTQTVLTFCHISKLHEFFTVIISREPWINRKDLNHIHDMLERKQLSIQHTRSMCMEYRNTSNTYYNCNRIGMLLTLSALFCLSFQYFSIYS